MSNRASAAANRESYRVTRTVIAGSTAETVIRAAEHPHSYSDLVRILITNKSATAEVVTIRDVTGSASGADFAVPAGQTVGVSGPATAAWPQLTPGASWTAQCTNGVTSIVIHAVWIANN